MLLRLPEDLLITLLNEWLKAKLSILSRLDVACCSHGLRGTWLHLLHQLRRVSSSPEPSGSKAGLRSPITAYLKWIQDRGFYLESMVVDLNRLDVVFQWEALRLPSFKAIKFLPAAGNSSPKGILQFLSLFPSLTSIEFDGCVLDDQELMLWALRPLTCPLRRLRLHSCNPLPLMLTGVIATMHGTLQDLRCDGLDDWAVHQMAQHCRGMRKISWRTCAPSLRAETILAFCSSNRLLSLFDVDARGVTDELMPAVAALCPELKEIVLGERCAVSCSLLSMLTVSSKLQSISLPQALLTAGRGQGRGVSDLTALSLSTTNTLAPVDALHLLAAVQLPIRRLSSKAQHPLACDSAALRLLGDRHGSSLTKVELRLIPHAVAKEDLLHFLSSCSGMRSLFLECPQRMPMVEDDLLRRLPVLCPHLEHMAVSHCGALLTDSAVCCYLRGTAGERLRVIALCGCPLLTDAVLQQIQTSCFSLASLLMVDTSVTKEGMLGAAMALAPRALQRVHCSTEADGLWVTQQLQALQIALHVEVLP